MTTIQGVLIFLLHLLLSEDIADVIESDEESDEIEFFKPDLPSYD